MTDPAYAIAPEIPRTARLARWLLFRLLAGLTQGSLTLHEGGQRFHFGDENADLRAEVQVLSPLVWRRLLSGGSLAAAEAWMDGEWHTSQLSELLHILARNRPVLTRLEKGLRLLGMPLQRLGHWMRRNHRQQARKNIAAHYDLSLIHI